MTRITVSCCSYPDTMPLTIMATIEGNCVDKNGTAVTGSEFALNWSEEDQGWVTPGPAGPFASLRFYCVTNEYRVDATFVDDCAFPQTELVSNALCPGTGDPCRVAFYAGGCCDDPVASLGLLFTLGVPDKAKFPPEFVPMCPGGSDPACCPPPPPEVCVDCDDCEDDYCPAPPRPQAASPYPVRYGSGETLLNAKDLETGGFGLPWGHLRTYTSRLDESVNVGNGFNWQVAQWPYVVTNPQQHVAVMGRVGSVLWFQRSGDGFLPMFDSRESLTWDGVNLVYKLQELDGSITEFDGLYGMFLRKTSPGGDTIEVVDRAENGFNFTTVERAFTVDGSTTTEQFLYDYSEDSEIDLLLLSVTLRRKVDTGSWQNVKRVVYTYYDGTTAHGANGDLESATTQTWTGSEWQDTGTSMYRYYLGSPSSSSSSSSSSGAGDSAHLIRYVVEPEAFERLAADPNVTDPLNASDAIVALYADFYFEYDGEHRVTKETAKGGSMEFSFAYTESTFADGYNSWKYKTTETRPDGAEQITYQNYAGQVMLSVLKEGSDQWLQFYLYDANGDITWAAEPSAVTGYDDTKADLLNNSGGTYQYLRDNDGLIRTYTYLSATGKLTREGVQQGQLGSEVKIREFAYTACEPATSSSSSSSSSSSGGAAVVPTYRMSLYTEYPSATNQTLKTITSFTYTYHTGTCAVAQKTTTLPVVSTAENGSGVAATRRDYYDAQGRRVWTMDERGYISKFTYDEATAALTQYIADVDTSEETDAPVGWTTPSGGGLNLVTDFESDDQGRITQSLGPAHTVDLSGTATTIRQANWFVYDNDDDTNITRSAAGYATGSSPNYTYTLVNPVSISIANKNGSVVEQIQATRATTAGKLSPSDTFAQSSYTRWTTFQYSDCCQLTSQRVYHTIPASGTGASGTNYDQTNYGYDGMRRRIRSQSPGGTISRQVLDVRDQVTESWLGTDDTGATPSDPSGGGATGNNMVIIASQQYDDGNDGGDGLLTKQTQYADATDTRVTSFGYDFRGRRTESDGEIDAFQKVYFDNLSRVIKTERYDTTAAGNLVARSETKYDSRGNVYQSIRYGVDPSTGNVGNSLTDNQWYDASGRVIKSLPSGADRFTKTQYDSLGRRVKQFQGYDLDETTYAEAETVTGDTILEQTESTYDDASNLIQVTARQRYHNAPASQTGELKSPSETPKARVSYSAQWSDARGRTVASASYGTNGGSSLTRPSTIPARSDTVLITSQTFDDAGNLASTTNPGGIITCLEFDDVGREIRRIDNCVSSSSSSAGGFPASLDANVTVETAYNADGNVSKLTAKNSLTGDQVTEYVYGTTLSDSEVASSQLKRKEIYPDSSSTTDVVLFAYNRQGQTTAQEDQNGTVHSFDYDKLGRQTQDRVTTLGSGVDGAVRRIATSYEVRGMRETITSYDNANVGAGSVVNENSFEYNDFGQLTKEYQSHAGTVNTSTTPNVQYGFANGSGNTIRPTTLTYPNGRVLTYDYGSSAGMADALSRVAALVDDDVSSTHLTDYEYLGLSSFVEVDYTEPEVRYTLVGTAGGSDPDTGDIYRGLDRFGRITDSYWYDDGSSTDVDRIQYGYDRNGIRTYRENVVAAAQSKHFDELYGNDALSRLQTMDRGSLNTAHTSISNLQYAEQWGLDETGNWRGFREDDDGNGTWDLDQRRTTNEVNEITAITETAGPSWATPSYDAAGNMTSIPKPADPTASFTATFDAWNRLVKVVDGSDTVAEYQYDGAKRRVLVRRYVSGSLDETRHAYFTEPASWQLIEERVDNSTDPKLQFVWGRRYIDDCVLRDRDTTSNGTLDERLYALQDGSWNVTSIVSASGAVQERFAYSPYGAPMFLSVSFAVQAGSGHDWVRLFAGYQFDTNVQWYAVRHRSYAIGYGWAQRDPYAYEDGVNLYEFDGSKPTSFIDPDGRALKFIIPIGLVLVGGVWVYKNDPAGEYDWLKYNEKIDLGIIKLTMIGLLETCPGGGPSEVPAMINAIESCPIVGKFEAGKSPDGSDGTSLTWNPGWAWWPKVILANNFFTTKTRCEQFMTLLKECYLRVHIGDYDDTGVSDNAIRRYFASIQCCLACCGHVGPKVKGPNADGRGCCPC